MAKLYLKAQDLEEYDSVKIFNERGKEVYYTKDEFIATGHRIKIYLADTITECAYVQEKTTRDGIAFEFCSKDRFGTVVRDKMSILPKYKIDYDEPWEVEGDAVMWQYIVHRGMFEVMKVRSEGYLIPGQALNITDTHILDIEADGDVLICLAFALAVYALNKYSYMSY